MPEEQPVINNAAYHDERIEEAQNRPQQQQATSVEHNDAAFPFTPYALQNTEIDRSMCEPTSSTLQPPSAQRPSSKLLHPTVAVQQDPHTMIQESQSTGSDDDSPGSRTFQSYLGDVGCMQIFGADHSDTPCTGPLPMERYDELDQVPHELMQSYLETYFNYIQSWCPVLDKQTLKTRPNALYSPLLKHALALCGVRLNPPLIAHTSCASHYKRAKGLFYANYPETPISQISALMLFHWYSLSPPNAVSTDSNWWWVGTTIRLAQQIGLHRDTTERRQPAYEGETPELRRRIWWTLFVRDRIAALAQGLPLIIDKDYCDIQMITVTDFPDPAHISASIFVEWVRLWDVGGRIHKELLLKGDAQSKALLAQELIDWAHGLPSHLQLPIGEHLVLDFNRDLNYLHLGYLAIVIVLHLSKSQEILPRATVPAIVAASCVAGIFRAYLSRGTVQYLGCEAVWYCTLAILALLRARRVDMFTHDADVDITTLRLALRELSRWSLTGKMFDRGLDRLLKEEPLIVSACDSPSHHHDIWDFPRASGQDATIAFETRWLDYFPGITAQTSPLVAGFILRDCIGVPSPQVEWSDAVTLHLQDLFRDIEGWND
ncbi:hypothetical protein LTS17_007437 [Exophiala oligosperma]